MLHVRQRLQTYRFFASLFRYPEVALLQEIDSEKIAEIASWLQCASHEFAVEERLLETLQENYTGLFVARPGGVPAPLYGSVYLDDGQLMGESTLQVADHYRARGLSIGDDGEPPDFLSTELEYLYYLVEQEVEGLALRQLDKVREMTGAQQDFISNLLLPWLEPFTGRLQVQGAGLWSWGASALLAFIRQESAWLGRLS